jgi:hypothetical protein
MRFEAHCIRRQKSARGASKVVDDTGSMIPWRRQHRGAEVTLNLTSIVEKSFSFLKVSEGNRSLADLLWEVVMR